MASNKRQRITPTGNACTNCKQLPGYVELDTLCVTCFQENVVDYYEFKLKSHKQLLQAAKAYAAQHDVNRSV